MSCHMSATTLGAGLSYLLYKAVVSMRVGYGVGASPLPV